MPVHKGAQRPQIGSHGGGSVAVSDVSSSLQSYEHGSHTFEPDPSGIADPGPKVFKFPLDDVSAGNFWTRLIINSWVPVAREEIVKGQGHGLDKDSLANIWLPMPLTLGTTYNQRYTQTDNMMVNRGSSEAGNNIGGYTGIGSEAFDQGAAVMSGAASEFADFVSSMANVNNSGKMAMGSIQNQMMGLVYDGASLRSHTLNWRMIPKNREEQNAIETVCFAFKKFSAPVVKDLLGGEISYINSQKAHKKSTMEIDESAQNGVRFDPISADGKLSGGVKDSMRSIGRLGIPVTVNVEFWYGEKRNPHLFQIKDSFIESVEINYTPTGTWNAYEDGAPIETQLNVTFKENAIITQDDVTVGGY